MHRVVHDNTMDFGQCRVRKGIFTVTSAEFGSNSCRLPHAKLIVMRDAPDTAAVLQRLQHRPTNQTCTVQDLEVSG